MRVGTDNEGREITFEQGTHAFAIGGIATTFDHVIAYDRGGQIGWESPEIQAWAYDYDRIRQSYAVEQQAAQEKAAQAQRATRADEARRSAAIIQGYDAGNSARLAGFLNGIATVVVVGFVVVGAINGLVLGAVVGRQFPLGLLLFPLLFGGTGWLVGYVSVLFIRVVAQGLLVLTQTEANTRRP